MASHLDDPGYWRERAAELRAIADHLTDDVSREQIIACATDYDILADRAEERLRSGRDSK